MSVTKKIDDLCAEAIGDLKRKIEIAYKKKYGCDRIVAFREASKILGMKYYQMNFGKMPMHEVIAILNDTSEIRRPIKKWGEKVGSPRL